MATRRIAQCILIVSLLALSAVGARAATVTLRERASVDSDIVRLTDIAVVTADRPEEHVEQFRSIPICSAPPPAEMQLLTLNSIVHSLMASGADFSRLKFAGPGQVIVSREFDLVSDREFENSFAEHVSEVTGWPRNSFVVQPPKNLDPLPVPAGKREIAVDTAPDEDFRGSVATQFQIVVDGQPYQTVTHRFTIERYVEALVTGRKISRGSPVSASDVEVKRVEQSYVEHDTLTREEQVEGMLATRTLFPGRVLTEEMITPPPVVHRGDTASVVCEGNGFSVSTRARVLDDGCVDEIVRVRLATRKTVKAVVLDSATLQLVEQGD